MEDRVAALEREMRRWRLLAVGVVMIASAALVVCGAASDEVRVKRLVLLDEGAPAAVLAISRDILDQPTLSISDAKGTTRAALSVDTGWVETGFELYPPANERQSQAKIKLFSGGNVAGMFVFDQSGHVGKFWAAGDETKIEIVTMGGTRGFSSAELK